MRTAGWRFVAKTLIVSLAVLHMPLRSWGTADRTESPYFFIENGDPTIDRLPLAETAVTVRITGVVVDVTVRQTYKNSGTRPITARYVFPASTRAAVHGMRMIIGSHVIEAKVRERQKAKREFEKARKAGKSASLLEQSRPNVFGMNVANIMPGDSIHVELQYVELLVPTDGIYEFVYPTVVGPRYARRTQEALAKAESFVANPYTHEGSPPTYRFALEGTVSTGVPVKGLESPSHEIHAHWDSPSRVEFSLDEGEALSANRDFVLRYRLVGDRITSGLLLDRGSGENFFLVMMQPPRAVTPDQIPAREYVFIVDVSGSMHGFPLETAKDLMRDLVLGLRPTDTFDVILFSGASRVLWPRSQAATTENVEHAVQVLDGLQGGGGTELLAAMQRALALPATDGRARTFIVVTDGFIAAEDGVFRYVREHLGQANVFTFGIGSSVNRYLVEGLARAGMGEPFVVLGPAGAPAAAGRFRDYVASPVLTHIHVTFSGFDTYDVEPTAIPDLFAQRPIIVHGKWRGRAEGRIVLEGTAGGAYRDVIDVSKVEPDSTNRALPYFWARTRIAALSDDSYGRGGPQSRDRIIELGLRYNLLTRYTSFVAVHQVIRNTSEGTPTLTQPSPLPRGVSDLAVGEMTNQPRPGMESGSEPALWITLAVLLTVFLGFGRRPSRSRSRPVR